MSEIGEQLSGPTVVAPKKGLVISQLIVVEAKLESSRAGHDDAIAKQIGVEVDRRAALVREVKVG